MEKLWPKTTPDRKHNRSRMQCPPYGEISSDFFRPVDERCHRDPTIAEESDTSSYGNINVSLRLTVRRMNDND